LSSAKKVIFWKNTYFDKRNLFALVSKANLILFSYSLQISYTLNLCSQNIFDRKCVNLLIRKSFKDLFYSISLSIPNLYFGRDTTIKPQKQWIRRLRDSIFFKTSTLDVNYDGCHQKRVSSPDPEILRQESTL
jgi:hypothetical protein